MNNFPASVGIVPSGNRDSRGFTLVEVLVSLIILSVGLLGLGLLQAQSLKSSYSANHRTIATNLAYELLDEIRANRRLAYRYSYIAGTDITGLNVHTCSAQPNTGDPVADDINGWECQVAQALPNGSANVILPAPPPTGGAASPGNISININWQDQRFSSAADQASSFTLQTEL